MSDWDPCWHNEVVGYPLWTCPQCREDGARMEADKVRADADALLSDLRERAAAIAQRTAQKAGPGAGSVEPLLEVKRLILALPLRGGK